MTLARQRLEHLATAIGPRVLTYLARRTVTTADAADIYQEVLVVTWRRLDRVPDDDQEALGWMLATARRCLSNHRRGTARRCAATQRLGELLRVTPPALDPADDRLRAALRRLSDDNRELLTLVYWDDLTCEEAAAVLRIKAPTARKRLERARQRLRRVVGNDEPSPLTASVRETSSVAGRL